MRIRRKWVGNALRLRRADTWVRPYGEIPTQCANECFGVAIKCIFLPNYGHKNKKMCRYFSHILATCRRGGPVCPPSRNTVRFPPIFRRIRNAYHGRTHRSAPTEKYQRSAQTMLRRCRRSLPCILESQPLKSDCREEERSRPLPFPAASRSMKSTN